MHSASPTFDDALLATSPAVTRVFDEILTAVHEGRLQPGQRISDAELAAQFGISRTPVREALQRLREIGIIEASASRFTRVAVVTPLQTSQAYSVWLALYRALVEETVPEARAATVDAMRADNANYLAALVAEDNQQLARANFDFFSRLQADSQNAALRRALTSVVHLVRLGALHLPARIDLATLGEAQRVLIDAAAAHDVAAARRAMDLLGGIHVPTE